MPYRLAPSARHRAQLRPQRVRTADAVIAIKNMDVKLQQYRLDQGSYPDDLAAIGMLGNKDLRANNGRFIGTAAEYDP